MTKALSIVISKILCLLLLVLMGGQGWAQQCDEETQVARLSPAMLGSTPIAVSDDPTDQFPNCPVRSVGVTATELDNEGTISVTSNIATFSVAFPTNVGVGDFVQYDVDNNGSIVDGEYGIIKGINSTRTKAYLVKGDGKTSVTNTTAATSVYDIFRSYTSLLNWESTQ